MVKSKIILSLLLSFILVSHGFVQQNLVNSESSIESDDDPSTTIDNDKEGVETPPNQESSTMRTAKFIVGGAVVGSGVVVATPFILSAVGFTSVGIAAGTIAANTMAYLGSGSLIVGSAQSIGAAGVATSTIVFGGTAGATLGNLVSKFFVKDTNQDNNSTTTNEI
ncbi:hypothetical protein DLAC_06364 [Tieghemostelium lacteum]|uniref:Transmembrane protein n=1 Tax=Tieghemostelium lacteum TaxID=361077 RepID=A0A151ZEK9_TIELA|nr:hypothetical protein DLAC_06364 [Tieghemostelium lacteum]|eukprot:KYQ92393.1 hypothetical protein DLAC_06364 [Tieghemostelium lacteum]